MSLKWLIAPYSMSLQGHVPLHVPLHVPYHPIANTPVGHYGAAVATAGGGALGMGPSMPMPIKISAPWGVQARLAPQARGPNQPLLHGRGLHLA